MRVLITGATGLVGTALTEALLARGDEIVGLTRNADRARAKQPAVDWHEWQPPGGAGGGETPPVTAFEGVDAIVNLQGERIDQRWTDEAKRRIMESRRDATRVLAETVARLAEKPAVVVSGSAVGIYGDRGDDPVDENSATGLDLAAGQGGPAGSRDSAGFDTLVVGAWEQAAEGFGNVGVRLVNLRTGHVLDPSGGLLP